MSAFLILVSDKKAVNGLTSIPNDLCPIKEAVSVIRLRLFFYFSVWKKHNLLTICY
jgi:hypothetical protein